LHIGEQAQPELQGIEAREIPVYEARRLEPPHPLQGRRDRQIDLARELRYGDAPVLLQPHQEPAIYAIERPVKRPVRNRRVVLSGGLFCSHGSKVYYHNRQNGKISSAYPGIMSTID